MVHQNRTVNRTHILTHTTTLSSYTHQSLYHCQSVPSYSQQTPHHPATPSGDWRSCWRSQCRAGARPGAHRVVWRRERETWRRAHLKWTNVRIVQFTNELILQSCIRIITHRITIKMSRWHCKLKSITQDEDNRCRAQNKYHRKRHANTQAQMLGYTVHKHTNTHHIIIKNKNTNKL